MAWRSGAHVEGEESVVQIAAPGAVSGLVSTYQVQDFVGISRETFSHAMRNAVEQARAMVGHIEGIEVAPPWHVSLTEEGDIEFRTTVRIIYRSD